jgi:tetratricopeptide (TPR) repeat protein
LSLRYRSGLAKGTLEMQGPNLVVQHWQSLVSGSAWTLFGLILWAGSGCQHHPPSTTPIAEAKTANRAAELSPLPDLYSDPDVAAVLDEMTKAGRASDEACFEWLDRRLTNNPTDIPARILRANYAIRLGNAHQSIVDLTEALRHRQNEPRLLNNRGFAHLALGNYQEALADLDKAIELRPDFSKPYNQKGLVYIATTKYRPAVEVLTNALKLEPSYSDAWNNRGLAYIELGEPAKALADLGEALRLNPASVNAYNNRGLLKYREGDYEAALLDFTQAMMRDPLNPKYYEHRRQVYLRQGDIEQARRDERKMDWIHRLGELTVAARHAKDNPVPHLALAGHYLKEGDTTGAEGAITKALEIDPANLEARITRAGLLFKAGRFEAAIEQCDAVLSTEPSIQAHSVRGDCFLEMTRYEQAVAEFEAARRLDPAVALACWSLAAEKESAGDTVHANELRARAIELDAGVAEKAALAARDGTSTPR